MKLCLKCQKHFSDDANFCPVDAARLVPLEAPAAGQDALTSKFDLGQRLGGSRTGTVQRAVDKATGKTCVIKIVAPAVMALPGVAQRIERELKQLERVKSAGVCQVLGSGKRGDETWLAIELLDGAQTLAEAIGARGPLPQDQAANLIELIGEALIEAAQVGVVHRDLAPKNILFAGQDIKLINFSLPVPTNEKIPGVAEFVAPEQVEGRPVDQRSNLYSLGALYYYVLTGQTPFAGAPKEVHQLHVNGAIKPPSQLVPIPQPIEGVIMRALDRSPTKRFLTVRQFVDEVQRVGHGEVIELKATMAMGKANVRPKGDLVQTLLGVKGMLNGLPGIASAPTINPQPAVSPVQALAAAAMPAPAAAPPATTLGIGQATIQSAPPMDYQPGAGMAHALASAPSAMSPLTPPSGVEPQRSPWASPADAAAAAAAAAALAVVAQSVVVAAPVVAAPVVAAPVVAAPVLAAPVVASPQVLANAAAAGGKRKVGGAEDKGKFRETMWFKKGDLDAQAAQAAAEERARTGKDAANDKADSKAMDERYNDDGSITRGDKEKYSLRTGATQMMPSLKDQKAASKASQSLTKVSEDELIGEMKGLPKWLMAAIALGVVGIVIVIIAFAT